MGVFTGNTTSLGNYDPENIIANESYCGTEAAFQMMQEGFMNDQAIFEAVLEGDFEETVQIKAGVYNESVEIIQEGASELVEKIKAAVKKAWEKLKGLFKSFIAKLDGVIMRDNKALFKKYQKTVYSKANLSGMKFKWAKPKKVIEKMAIDSFGDLEKSCQMKLGALYHESDVSKISSEVKDGTYLEAVLSDMLGSSTDAKSFAKDYHESCFEDVEKESDGLGSDTLKEISRVLQENKLVSGTQKVASEMDKIFVTMLKNLDNLSKTAVNNIVKDSSKEHTDKLSLGRKDGSRSTSIQSGGETGMKKINLAREIISTVQRATNMGSGAYLTAVKFHVAQCRRVWVQAASFNGKAQNESALFEAIGESAEWEAISTFESYEY